MARARTGWSQQGTSSSVPTIRALPAGAPPESDPTATHLVQNLERVHGSGTPVDYVERDAAERGIDETMLGPGLVQIDYENVANPLERHAQVFAW